MVEAIICLAVVAVTAIAVVMAAPYHQWLIDTHRPPPSRDHNWD